MSLPTVLDMTQELLGALSSDEVNSIGDSTESLQVAHILKRTYLNMISRGDLPEHNQLFQLNPSLDPTQPVMMFIPDGIGRVEYVKYFNTGSNAEGTFTSPQDPMIEGDSIAPSVLSPIGYQYVTMLPIEQFLDMTSRFDPAMSFVDSFTFSDTSNRFPNSFTFYYRDDKQPQYCCILSNFYVIFDSYDNTQDSTLQASKSQVFGQVVPDFKLEDSFIPDLDAQQFPLLINEAKSLAFFELKQQPHAKAEQEAKRQWSTVQKNKSLNNKPDYFNQIADFGRKAPYTHRQIVWR